MRRLVGAGAFADVYLGMHIYLNSRVAIKVLHTHVNALTWESFLAEARHLSQLEHAHIIHILDFSIEARASYMAGDLALRQQDPESAAASFAASLELFGCQKNKGGMAACLSKLGFIVGR